MKKHNKFLKSLLAIIVAILMVGSVIPTVAFAADADTSLIEEEASIGAILAAFNDFIQNVKDFFQRITDFFNSLFGKGDEPTEPEEPSDPEQPGEPEGPTEPTEPSKPEFPEEADGVVTISTLNQLLGFAKLVNEGITYSGKTVKLANDIDLAGVEWTPIGSWDKPFEGTFDGQGHTISNLYINAPERDEVGFFGCAFGATIKGINVKNVDILGHNQVAAIVGCPYSGCLISDCHVTGDIKIVADYAYAGGIAAYGYVDIDNCSVIADGTGVITAIGRNAVGGICAWLLEYGDSITNCRVENLDLTGWANIGSITGFVNYNNVIDSCTAKNINLTKTRLDGNGTIGLAAGGWSYGAGKTITITNNSFENISLTGYSIPNDGVDILYGSEYGGAVNNSIINASDNAKINITDNRIFATAAKNVATLKAALENGGIVNLCADVDMGTETLTVAKDVTLYLNGFELSGICNAGQSHLIKVKNGAALTVIDNSADESGKITYAKGTSGTGWAIDLEGELNLYSGTIELTGDGWSIGYAVDARPNAWGTGYTEGTVFHMYGGKIVSSDGAVRVASSSHDDYTGVSASFVMDGGEIDAAWDGIFIQQSNATYDILNVTINGGTITSALAPIRIYGPNATGTVGNASKPMTLTVNGGNLVLDGEPDTSKTWFAEGKVMYAGGMTLENLNNYTTITIA